MLRKLNARRTSALAIALFTATTVMYALGDSASASATTHTTTASASISPMTASPTSRIPISQLKIVNYFPSNAAWDKMWSSYNHATVAADFAAIASLGANAVRVIVPPYVLGWTAVSSTGAANFADLVNTARASGLSLQVTLFNNWGTYVGRNAGAEQWVSSLLAPYANDNEIALVELQSEIDPYNADAMAWARVMLPYLSTVLPGVPRTISVRGLMDASNIEQLNSQIPASMLDVFALHLYASIDGNDEIITDTLALANGRPVTVNEAGLSTLQEGSTAMDQSQAQYDSTVATLCKAFNLPPFAPWTLNDFSAAAMPTGVQSNQSFFGLRNLDGTWKPAAQVVKAMFAPDPTAAYDGGFENEARTYNGAGSLGKWGVSYNSYATSAGTVAGAGINGSAAGYLTGTVANSSGVPALSQSFSLGAATSVTATVKVLLLSGTGSTRMSIAWFGPQNKYLSQTESSPAANATTSWQTLTVTSAAPTGATAYQVALKSQTNSGTADFDNVVVTTNTQQAPQTDPAAAWDGGFENEARTYTSNGSLGYWGASFNYAAQSMGTVAGAGVNGSVAGYLTGTGGDASAVPALSQSFPLGNLSSVTVSSQVRLESATGSTRMAIAWFANDAYVTQTESSSADNTSTAWQTLSVTSTPPAGATSYQVHLKSGSNSGSSYFDNVMVTTS